MGYVGCMRDTCAIRVMGSLVREIDAIHGDVDFDYIVNRIEPMIRDELKGPNLLKKTNLIHRWTQDLYLHLRTRYSL